MPRINITTQEAAARELGVSKTTVSRALSGKGRVGEATRERVLQYFAQMEQAQGILRRKAPTHNLAIVIPSHFVQLDLPFLRKCMGAICRVADQRGYDILLCYADAAENEQLRRQLAAGKIDGAILTRALVKDPCVALLQEYGVPFVVMGEQADPSILQVDNDQVEASLEMTRLLLQLGMKRIAYIGGSLNYAVNANRLKGYLSAFAEVGITPETGLYRSDAEGEESRTEVLEAVLEHKPECILCCDDNLAVYVGKELRRRGIRVPEDLRLASLYDSELLLDVQPPVTAVHFDAAALGAASCRLLLDVLAGRPAVQKIVQGHQMILRESTK